MNSYIARNQESSLLGFEGEAGIGRVRVVLQTSHPHLIGFTIVTGSALLWMILG
ncbi:hypothetical protein PXK30_09675 [Phaeobacter gallaeciensis]|uniref:hypothetical protein n=1 Tax=Phaeobacter gallaeciensis TaxID=60890 RepID=UPI00237F47EC|nr:hypothetical protein [Phaeobacter gallaeciensis]MDE4303608.1 hypothetical protein [Phaeobacter gallaeciensis]MDE4307910.1 hypothetical protein [Phaeobacter gallaeciensis]MDE4312368.1 hypothetical protein [Phaeobacter gallaeciensis]MDE4316839.1 hypothetical protein [Phaeobacter gallaeciensis]MDE4321302.1 hypothetical protein [Phaeobacter gallaeciensis]